MPARNQRIASNLDGPTVVLFLLLAGLGWWNLVSASTGLDGAVEWSLSTLHGKQALWLVASLVLGALIPFSLRNIAQRLAVIFCQVAH